MQVVIIKSPERNIDQLKSELKGLDVFVIDDPVTMGKENFYKRMNQAFEFCLKSKHNKFLIIHDDCINVDLDCHKLINESDYIIFTPHTDNRQGQWGGNLKRKLISKSGKYQIVDVDFNDCMLLTNRKTLEAIGKLNPTTEQWRVRHTSSGVGYQITNKAREIGVKLYGTIPSILYHGLQDSVMHSQERKSTPLVSDMGKKIVVGMATFKGRERQLEQSIDSLKNQVDEIVIYDNSKLKDKADNGKFYALQDYKEPIYFLSCDDDLRYPIDYVAKMIDDIERFKCIVSHHGRILQGKDLSYYMGHDAIRFNAQNTVNYQLDVCGTGVTGFDTSYFNPTELHNHKELRMSDIIFSLEAKKQGKKIIAGKHNANWIKQIPLHGGYSICEDQIKSEERQIKYANKIWRLKNLK